MGTDAVCHETRHPLLLTVGGYAVDGSCSKPQALCEPSQKGFMSDCPQRQRAAIEPLGLGIVEPSLAFSVSPSVEIRIGPFALMVISAMALSVALDACSGCLGVTVSIIAGRRLQPVRP